MIYLELFLSFLKVGFFGFGGGYAMLSLIEDEVIVRHGWLSLQQFTDIVAISQMTPGPIAVNSATFVGYSVTGSVLGSIIATSAVCVPSLTLFAGLIAWWRKHRRSELVTDVVGWLRPFTTGMIGAAALLFFNRETFADIWSAVIFAVVFAAVWLKADPVVMLLLSAAAGIAIY